MTRERRLAGDAERALFAHNGGVTHRACTECDRLWDGVAAAWRAVWEALAGKREHEAEHR